MINGHVGTDYYRPFRVISHPWNYRVVKNQKYYLNTLNLKKIIAIFFTRKNSV